MMNDSAGTRSEPSLTHVAQGDAPPSMWNFGAMLLLAVIWGLSIPVTKLGLLTLSPLTLTALRFAIAVPLLLLCLLGSQRLPWRALRRLAALGVLGIGVGQLAQAYGVAATSASVGTIISATIPVFVVFFAALRLQQPVTGRQKLGLAAAFAGIALVAFDGQQASAVVHSSAVGVAWMLLSALAIAFYYVWSFELTREYGTAAVAAWSTLFGFIALVPWAGWEMWHAPIHISAQTVGVVAYLGIGVTIAGLFLWLHLLRTVPARIAASVQYLQPVIGIAAASAMFGERLGALFAGGVILVLGGLALTVTSRRRADQAT
jgi:drug/metabolite transporter (DMT)-like permease